MLELIENRISEIISPCKLHHVTSIAVSGSAVKDTRDLGIDIHF